MLMNKITAYHRMLEEERRAITGSGWARLAVMWKHLFDDVDEARRCMSRAKTSAIGTDGLIEVAKVWARELGEFNEAYRCMEYAEIETTSVRDWTTLAEVWAREFGDHAKAIHCMNQAEAKDVSYSNLDRKRIAETWVEIHHLQLMQSLKDSSAENNETLQSIAKAEAISTTSDDWTKLVMIWAQVFDNRSRAFRCMGRAESVAANVRDWVTIANCWVQEFNDQHQAFWCLKQAIAMANVPDDWAHITANLSAMGYSLRTRSLRAK